MGTFFLTGQAEVFQLQAIPRLPPFSRRRGDVRLVLIVVVDLDTFTYVTRTRDMII